MTKQTEMRNTKKFEKIHDKIKFKAFGKVTIRQRRIPKDKLE